MLATIIYACLAAGVLSLVVSHVSRYLLGVPYTSAPRYPDPFPFTGSRFLRDYTAAWASEDRGAWMRNLLANPGLTTVAHVWGTPWVFTAHPDNLRQMLTHSASALAVEPTRRGSSTVSYIGDGMFVSDGEKWRISRALFKPMFERASISKFQRLEKHVQKFLSLLPKDGETVDLQPMFKRFYLDVSTEMLFGVSVDSQEDSKSRIDVDQFEKTWQAAMFGMLQKVTLSWLSRLRDDDAGWKKDCAHVHGVFDELIDETIKRKSRRGDAQKSTSDLEEESMLEKLIEQSDDKRFLRDQLLNVFLGAKDTAGIGISDVFFHLARHPGVYSKLRDEVLSVRDQPITFELLKSMKYLQAVLAESALLKASSAFYTPLFQNQKLTVSGLRLLSPVTTAIRNTMTSITLPRGGGLNGQSPVYVPRGSRLEISISALHLDHEHWGSNAAEFLPDRWMRSEERNGNEAASRMHEKQSGEQDPSGVGKPWQYVPFLGGARICPAQQMVLTQYAYILVRFCQQVHRLENRDPKGFIGEIVFSLQSKNGVKVAVYR